MDELPGWNEPPWLPEYEVEADDSFRLRGLAAIEDGRLGLCPDKATVVHQETVTAGAHLTLRQHWMVLKTNKNSLICLQTRVEKQLKLGFNSKYMGFIFAV